MFLQLWLVERKQVFNIFHLVKIILNNTWSLFYHYHCLIMILIFAKIIVCRFTLSTQTQIIIKHAPSDPNNIFWSEQSACDQRSNLGRPLFFVFFLSFFPHATFFQNPRRGCRRVTKICMCSYVTKIGEFHRC